MFTEWLKCPVFEMFKTILRENSILEFCKHFENITFEMFFHSSGTSSTIRSASNVSEIKQSITNA